MFHSTYVPYNDLQRQQGLLYITYIAIKCSPRKQNWPVQAFFSEVNNRKKI